MRPDMQGHLAIAYFRLGGGVIFSLGRCRHLISPTALNAAAFVFIAGMVIGGGCWRETASKGGNAGPWRLSGAWRLFAVYFVLMSGAEDGAAGQCGSCVYVDAVIAAGVGCCC